MNEMSVSVRNETLLNNRILSLHCRHIIRCCVGMAVCLARSDFYSIEIEKSHSVQIISYIFFSSSAVRFSIFQCVFFFFFSIVIQCIVVIITQNYDQILI